MTETRDEAGRQRIDRWLWHARLVRTRAAAAALAESGHVRVNGQRVTAPSRPVRIGDVLTVALSGGVKVLRVQGFVGRRGGADDAKQLFEDLTPPPAALPSKPPASGPTREPGSGRPTKRDRRALERDRFIGKRNAFR
ncbi:MAG: RNA-binding S4 domain-containing protein [Bradyrhizobiaceae bacterium]|nr:RNA-binding S4 domain-containing protein [Bradyrhizobiaceae bacterium]